MMNGNWGRNILWGMLLCAAFAGLLLVPGLALTLAMGYGIYLGVRALKRRVTLPPGLNKFFKGLGICLAAGLAIAAPGAAILIALCGGTVHGVRVLLRKRNASPQSAPSGEPAWRAEEPEAASSPENFGEPGDSPGAPEPSSPAGTAVSPPVKSTKGRDILKGLLICLAAAGGLLLVKLVLISLVVAAGFVLLFSSCTDHGYPHSRREVLAYVREEFPGEEVVISRDYRTPEYEDGRETKNRVWDCHFEDLPEMPFTIGSYYWNGGPVPVWGYSLSDTAGSAARDYYLEKYLEGRGSLDIWETGTYRFEMEFTSMEDVRRAVDQLEDYTGWYALQPHAGTPPNAYGTLTGLRLPAEALNWDSTIFGDEDAGLEERCGNILKSYYAFYNLPSPDFSEEEVRTYARETWEWDGFVPMDWETGEWMSRKDFQDVRLERNRVSFGGLYTVLERVGAVPEGTPEHWAVTGADGCRYEFSYDFQTPEGGEIYWYYLKDGERMPVGMNEPNAPVLRWEGDEIWALLIPREPEEEPPEAPPLELKSVPAA